MSADKITFGGISVSAWNRHIPGEAPVRMVRVQDGDIQINMPRDVWRRIVAACGIQYLQEVVYGPSTYATCTHGSTDVEACFEGGHDV